MSLKDNSCNLCVYLSFPQSIKFKSSLALTSGAGDCIRSFDCEDKQWRREVMA